MQTQGKGISAAGTSVRESTDNFKDGGNIDDKKIAKSLLIPVDEKLGRPVDLDYKGQSPDPSRSILKRP